MRREIGEGGGEDVKIRLSLMVGLNVIPWPLQKAEGGQTTKEKAM